jgi:hypothetical protein
MAVMRFVVGLLIACGLAVPAAAQGVTARFMTTPAGGNFAPRNVVAVWVEDAQGNFVKTIGRWAGQRRQYLLAWNGKAGTNDVDAVTSATRGDHLNTIQAVWNLQNKAGQVVPDGTYTIRMELADRNSTAVTQNNEGTFTFVKSANPQVQTNLSSGGFTNVSISYAAAAACGNSVIDPGETCDPAGSCPTSCPASADACMPNVLVGTAATCTAQCETQLITACANDDGCCPQGCTEATDTDCGAGGGSGGGGGNATDTGVQGGCASTPSGSLVVLLGAGLLVLRRRTQR